jgi:hypothetical protein
MTNHSAASRNVLTFAVAAGLLTVLIGSALPMQAFGHALSIESINVDGVGERGIFIVIGHTSEPTFGAFPGIHDGKHNVEVFLEDLDTALPLAGSSLKIDKFYFEDINSFNNADSVEDADEKEKGVSLSGVFGDPGHYITRQVTDDGIYGYRLYGTVNYFSVAELEIDTTVFCTEGGEGGGGADTSKFNSPGWFGAYGCHADIENIFFPEDLKNVKDDGSNGGGGGGGDKATITVESELADGSEFKKYVAISDETGKTVKKGFTPVEFEGKVGEDYTIEVRFQGSPQFDHWEDGSETRKRTITLQEDITLLATYGNDVESEPEKSETDSNTTAVASSYTGQIQQASFPSGAATTSSTMSVASSQAAQTPAPAIGMEYLSFIVSAAVVGSIVGIKRIRSNRSD